MRSRTYGSKAERLKLEISLGIASPVALTSAWFSNEPIIQRLMKDHESCHGNDTHHTLLGATSSKFPLRTRHQSKDHVRKHRSTAVHNNGFNV